VTDTADTEGRREERIPVDLNQPLVLDVHNPNGDVIVRATERTDVLISHITPGFGGDPGDEEIDLTIDARENQIEIRVNPGSGTGWAGIAGDIDLDTVVGEIDAVVGQITRAFRRGGHRASARPGRARVAVGRHAWTDVTIEVPQAITGRIGVHTASGDVRVEGVTSEIALNTVSGDVRVMRTSGDLVLQTASGDLAIEGASGRLTAQTASGDVNVTSVQIASFDIRTASGDVLFDAMLTGDDPFRVQTVSGDVRLALRRSTTGGNEPDATLAFHTVSGDAHVTQPFRKTSRRHWQAGSGERGPRIDVTTVSGDLVAGLAAVKSDLVPSSTPASPAGDVPPAPPAPPAPAIVPSQPSSPTAPAPFTMGGSRGEDGVAATDARPEAAQSPLEEDGVRLAVLEAVERGEIDVEEALRRLEAVDSVPGI
jgi:hypothetical protein